MTRRLALPPLFVALPAMLALPLLACAPAAPPSPPPAAPVESPALPPSAPPAAVPAAPPSAKVTEVVPSRDDVPYVRAHIVFQNPSGAACRVLGYKLVWGAQSKAITLKDLTLPPGETRDRWLKVNPGDGDLAALKPESGRVELQTECAR